MLLFVDLIVYFVVCCDSIWICVVSVMVCWFLVFFWLRKMKFSVVKLIEISSRMIRLV